MATYSPRTVCPRCEQRLPLECVAYTASFICPLCKGCIRVEPLFRTAQNVVSYVGGVIVPFLLGFRGATWLAFSVVLIVLLAGLQAYVVKYIVPPRLTWCKDDSASLHLNQPD